jgi:exosortase
MRNAATILQHPLAMPIAVALCLTWAYWSTLTVLAGRWSADPQYSHGFLVPVIAGVLVWLRRGRLNLSALRPCWWGLPVLLAALTLRLGATFYYFEWLDWASLVPSAIGVCLLVGGWQLWRCMWPALFFLVFMIPLPYTLEVAMASPLQGIATAASTFALQTIGFPAAAEGNIILINDARIGVAEACSGLRMLVVFFAVSTAVAIIIDRPVWERTLIVGCAMPIALVCNITRIVVTGVLHETVGREWADLVFHDLAGWLMMPMALALLWIVLHVLGRLLIDPPERETITVLPPRALPVAAEQGGSPTLPPRSLDPEPQRATPLGFPVTPESTTETAAPSSESVMAGHQ